jgi:hypothetical protein
MTKKKRAKKVNPWAGGIGTAHFLRSGAGAHTANRYNKRDRRAGKKEAQNDG